MEVFENMIARVESIRKSMPAARKRVLQMPLIKAQMIDMNTAQLSEGKESTGNPVTPPYAELTKSIKAVKGQPFDKVTLKDEGDFYEGWDIKYTDNTMSFFSKDSKAAALVKKYGGQIYGLTDENIIDVRQMTLPYFIGEARKLGGF